MTKILFVASLLICIALGLSGCGNHEEESLTYQLSSNGCDTGKHEFSSKAAYCNGLKDYRANNGCAFSLRKETYEKNGCPGTFEEINH